MKCVLFPTSSNLKTGNIIQSYSARESCPVRCPFKGSGCYGESYHTARQWARTENAEDPRAVSNAPELAAALVSAAAARKDAGSVLFRHNVAGDMARPGTSELDLNLLSDLNSAITQANRALAPVGKSVTAYTYTHCEINDKSAAALRSAVLIVNASCETAEECSRAISRGIPAAMACSSIDAARAALKAENLKAVQCPAQTHDGITCENCKLCTRRARPVVLFALHGNGAKKAARAIEIKAAKDA